MKFLMFRIVFKQFKIFNPVIVVNIIDMVDNFFRVKVSAQMFFHYNFMLHNITTGIRKGMVSFFNKNISIFIFNLATFPRMAFFTCLSFANFTFSFFRVMCSFATIPHMVITTFLRTIFSRIFFVRPNIKNLITVFTLNFKRCLFINLMPFFKFCFWVDTFLKTEFRKNLVSFYELTELISHNILQLKKAAFRSLIEIRLCTSTLLTAICDYKNNVVLLDNISISYLINFVKKKMEIKTWLQSRLV